MCEYIPERPRHAEAKFYSGSKHSVLKNLRYTNNPAWYHHQCDTKPAPHQIKKFFYTTLMIRRSTGTKPAQKQKLRRHAASTNPSRNRHAFSFALASYRTGSSTTPNHLRGSIASTLRHNAGTKPAPNRNKKNNTLHK